MWSNRCIQKISDIIRQNSVLPFQELKSQYNVKDVDIGRWLSIHTDTKVIFTPKTCFFQDIEGIRYPTCWQILFFVL